MIDKQASKANWLVIVIIGSSIPIMLIIIAVIFGLVSVFNSRAGIYDTTAMNVASFGGLYLAIPCGLLDIITGISARSTGLVKKKVAIAGIIIGVLGILIGLLSWVLFYMLSVFASTF